MSAPPNRYWRKNLSYLAVLLTVWFAASFGCGILFAQQGSIYIFVALVFVYVGLMNRLDHEFDDSLREPVRTDSNNEPANGSLRESVRDSFQEPRT